MELKVSILLLKIQNERLIHGKNLSASAGKGEKRGTGPGFLRLTGRSSVG
jgi:hypothetical protein